MISYKALEAGIRVREINPRSTSIKCKECGHISRENRDGVNFRCIKCGYRNHADFNAAWNISACLVSERCGNA